MMDSFIVDMASVRLINNMTNRMVMIIIRMLVIRIRFFRKLNLLVNMNRFHIMLTTEVSNLKFMSNFRQMLVFMLVNVELVMQGGLFLSVKPTVGIKLMISFIESLDTLQRVHHIPSIFSVMLSGNRHDLVQFRGHFLVMHNSIIL